MCNTHASFWIGTRASSWFRDRLRSPISKVVIKLTLFERFCIYAWDAVSPRCPVNGNWKPVYSLSRMVKTKKTRRGKRGSALNKKHIPPEYSSYADVLRQLDSHAKRNEVLRNLSGTPNTYFAKRNQTLSLNTKVVQSGISSGSPGRYDHSSKPRSGLSRGIVMPRISSSWSDPFKVVSAEESSPQSIVPPDIRSGPNSMTLAKMFILNHWRDSRPSLFVLFPQRPRPFFKSEPLSTMSPPLRTWLSDRGWKDTTKKSYTKPRR